MASVAFKLIEVVTAHAQCDSLEDARELCADGTYFPNNLSILGKTVVSETFSQPVFCPEFIELGLSTLLCNIRLNMKK